MDTKTWAGRLCGKPKAVAWGPNRLDLFVVGTDHQLYHKAWNGSVWQPSLTGYEPLGGIILGDPEAVAWGPNRLDIFVVGTDHACLSQVVGRDRRGGPPRPATNRWAGSFNMFPKWLPGVLTGSISSRSATDSALYHKAWNGSAWLPSLTGWENLGCIVSSQPEACLLGSEPARCIRNLAPIRRSTTSGGPAPPGAHRSLVTRRWAAGSLTHRRPSHGARTGSMYS